MTQLPPLLPRLLDAVAAIYGTEKMCIPATALLIEAAAHVGIILRPQPVSIWSGDAAGQSATGSEAHAYGLSLGAHLNINSIPPDACPWFHEVGHLVAISDEHALLLDPTYGQFGRPGAPHNSVLMDLQTLAPSDAQPWFGNDGAWYVRYWPVDEPDGWQESYANARAQLVPLHLASVIQAASETEAADAGTTS